VKVAEFRKHFGYFVAIPEFGVDISCGASVAPVV
jgi:hypothetical protein